MPDDALGQELAIPHGVRLRPVEAVRAWLDAAGIERGPIFRRIRKDGRIGAEALAGGAVALVVKHYAERAGFLTSGAAEALCECRLRAERRPSVLSSYPRRDSADLLGRTLRGERMHCIHHRCGNRPVALDIEPFDTTRHPVHTGPHKS